MSGERTPVPHRLAMAVGALLAGSGVLIAFGSFVYAVVMNRLATGSTSEERAYRSSLTLVLFLVGASLAAVGAMTLLLYWVLSRAKVARDEAERASWR